MNKNIIFTTMLPIWSMSNGSGGKALFNTIEAYIKNGYNVFIVTNQKNDYSNIEGIKLENIFYFDTTWYEKYNGNKMSSKLMAYLYFKDFERKSYENICKIMKNIDIKNTILYAYEVHSVKASKKASKKFNVPLVTRFQGTIMASMSNKIYNRIRKYPHIQALSTKADLVIMTDDGTQGDKVLKDYKNDDNILFIRNGVNILDKPIEKVDKELFLKDIGVPTSKTILLTVSRLEGWKRVDRTIKAFNELKNKEDYFLLILGDGAEKKNLEELVENFKLSDNIRFEGAVKNSEVNKYMQVADIFLSFYDLSNVGNPLLEALCLGKPIITYNVGDTNKIIDEKNGVLLDDVSPENISNNIENINNKETLNMYSENAYEYAKENLYSWKKRMEIEIETVNKLYK